MRQRIVRSVACVLAVAIAATAGARASGVGRFLASAPDDDAKEQTTDEFKKLEGTWKVLFLEMAGKKLPEDKKGPMNITIKGKRITLMGKAMDFKLDPGKKPKALDLHITRGNESVDWPCIYSVKGKELKIAMPLARKKGDNGAPPPGAYTRPTSFDTAGLPVMLITATREATKE
jgi:uncharacterized protein (TIGR03067 family)